MQTLTRAEGSKPEDFHLTKRGVASLFFAGYAVAAVSANAQATIVKTDTKGLITEEVKIPTKTVPLPAYVARPNAAGAFPVVVVINEIFGIHEYIRDTCRRLAKLGYVAVAPAFFHRLGDPSTMTDTAAIMRDIVGKTPMDQVMGDMTETVRWLKTQRFADSGKMAVTGFCWGGGATWMTVATVPGFKAGAAWYGPLARPAQPTAEVRKFPVEVAANLKAPVLGLYGGRDNGIPQNTVEEMRKQLVKAEKYGSTIVVYPEAQHGFHADYRASYNAAAATDAWAKMVDFFSRNGVAPKKYTPRA